jgi:hypothetical protein
MKKRYLIGLLLCCLMIIPLVGCSKKESTTGTKAIPKTPLQILTDRVNASDTKDSAQDTSITDLSNRITTEIAAVSTFDHAPFTSRLVALESLNMSTFGADLAFVNIRLATYDSYNVSARLAYLESRINASPTATPVPNGSTPTPTPTPTPIPTVALNCTTVTKPVSVFPTNGDMAVSNSTIMFQWSNCNATSYEFYFGNNSNTMTFIANTTDIPMFLKNSEIMPNTYYFWKVIAISPCGNKSSSWWFKTQ